MNSIFNRQEKSAERPTLSQIEQHCKQAINMALNSQETSYNLAFDVKATEEGLNFIFYSPSALLLNQDLYNKLTSIISTNVYPYFTVFPQAAPLMIPWDSSNIHKARAWNFPWKRGISKRLVVDDIDSFGKKYSSNGQIWLMPNYYVDISNLTSINLMGLSGSGKSILIQYINECFSYTGKVLTVDPKGSKDLVWWARGHDQEIIYPSTETSKADFLSKVNDRLSEVLQEVSRRQHKLLESPESAKIKFPPILVTIDELSSLTLNTSRNLVNAFQGLLETLTLISREVNCHLLLASQVLDTHVIASSVRAQSNLRILLGDVNSKSSQYLFPDYDVSSIVVPHGVGTGIISKINSKDISAITPFLAPTVKGWV